MHALLVARSQLLDFRGKRKAKLANSDGPIKATKAGLFSRKSKKDAFDPFARITAERNSF